MLPNVFAVELGKHPTVDEVAAFIDGQGWGERTVITTEQIPRHAVVHVMREMQADVERHQDETKRRQRGARPAQRIFGAPDFSAVFERTLELVQGAQHL